MFILLHTKLSIRFHQLEYYITIKNSVLASKLCQLNMRRANLVPRVLSSLSFMLASCMFSRFLEHKQSGTYSAGVGGE